MLQRSALLAAAANFSCDDKGRSRGMRHEIVSSASLLPNSSVDLQNVRKSSRAQVSLSSSEIEWRIYGIKNFQAHTRELASGKLAPLALQLYFSYLTEGL
jgi:hypothetical protein